MAAGASERRLVLRDYATGKNWEGVIAPPGWPVCDWCDAPIERLERTALGKGMFGGTKDNEYKITCHGVQAMTRISDTDLLRCSDPRRFVQLMEERSLRSRSEAAITEGALTGRGWLDKTVKRAEERARILNAMVTETTSPPPAPVVRRGRGLSAEFLGEALARVPLGVTEPGLARGRALAEATEKARAAAERQRARARELEREEMEANEARARMQERKERRQAAKQGPVNVVPLRGRRIRLD